MRRAVAVGVACLGVLLLASSPQDVATQVAAEIMSPFCPGVTLHDCPSAEADDLRREIVDMAAAGKSADAIIDELEEEYGPLRATPSSPVARLLPWALAVLGLGGAALLMRRFAARPGPHAPISADDRARLDAELRAFREES